MAIAAKLTLEKFGIDNVVDGYVCLQNVTVRQQFVDVTAPEKGMAWIASAGVFCFASREAKYAGKEPLHVGDHRIVFDPRAGDALTVLYAALKQKPEFAGAVDA